ncbi:hypothetical protein OIU85_002295 [Salix viminalis]|uniref:Uncharacterized protein n=1 Tax=Salix viminalis TaxID=40686 RepID=A0A9Q0VN59_SALVM|nr:hypothetical protein OIU85_002295 [Salix viminalis]
MASPINKRSGWISLKKEDLLTASTDKQKGMLSGKRWRWRTKNSSVGRTIPVTGVTAEILYKKESRRKMGCQLLFRV